MWRLKSRFTEGDYHYDDYDLCYQWFLLCCVGDLECSLDDIATDFLRRYYLEALKTPMAVNPLKLAEKMGLDVEVRDITKDLSIFGQVYFHDTEAEFYDSDKDEMVITSVNARTIFVDPETYFLRNLGAVNNTIVHECVHWDKHRKAFELERLYNSSATKIGDEYLKELYKLAEEVAPYIVDKAFTILFNDRMFLLKFNTIVSEVIRSMKKNEFPDLMDDDGVIKRCSYLPAWLRNGVFYRDRGGCQVCGKDLTGLIVLGEEKHFDHIIPLKKGGTNDPTNFQLLCREHSLEKSYVR